MTTGTRFVPVSARISLATDTFDTVLGIDWIAVERAANGETPDGLTIPEQQESIRFLLRRGLSRAAICRRLDIRPWTFDKWQMADKAKGATS